MYLLRKIFEIKLSNRNTNLNKMFPDFKTDPWFSFKPPIHPIDMNDYYNPKKTSNYQEKNHKNASNRSFNKEDKITRNYNKIPSKFFGKLATLRQNQS